MDKVKIKISHALKQYGNNVIIPDLSVVIEEGEFFTQMCIRDSGCAVRVRHGLEPACVKVCPSRALHLVHTGDVEGLDASRSLEKAGETVLKAQV